MDDLKVRRLRAGEELLAERLFRIMAVAFEESPGELRRDYIARLLGRSDFWALAATMGDAVVGGLTAHTLPMTRAEESELFIYDVAVAAEYRRQGIGRALMRTLVEAARAEGIPTVLVPAEEGDTDVHDFYRAIGGEESRVRYFLFT